MEEGAVVEAEEAVDHLHKGTSSRVDWLGRRLLNATSLIFARLMPVVTLSG